MKKLIKFAILLVVLAVFAFSGNSTIVKARTFVKEKGSELFSKGTAKLEASENESIAKIGEAIK
jgi:hypothetical protein